MRSEKKKSPEPLVWRLNLAIAFWAISATSSLAAGLGNGFATKCHASPLPESAYAGQSVNRIKFGKRNAAPLAIYSVIQARRSDDAYIPIDLRFYWPSLKGGRDDLVPKSQRLEIYLKVFPVDDWKIIPEDAEIANKDGNPLHNLRREYQSNPPIVTMERWGLQELQVKNVAGSYFYQPEDRKEFLHGIPTFICSGSIRFGSNHSCVGRMVAKPDFYITYLFNQELLPCWKEIERSVDEVARLNLSTSR